MDGRLPILLLSLGTLFSGGSHPSLVSAPLPTIVSQNSLGRSLSEKPLRGLSLETQDLTQNNVSHPPIESRYSKLCDLAKEIAVKVVSSKSSGSGVIVNQQGSLYTLLTSEHVLEPQISTYTVITVEGEDHQAQVLQRFNQSKVSGSDLALLQFRSSNPYKSATLAEWKAGEKVFAFGFPVGTNPSIQKGSLCTPLIADTRKLPQPMTEGYQLGSLWGGKIGMSGGPLMNEQGQVVGINGKAQPAIFMNDSLFRYRNGSPVALPLDVLSQYSWAIPINRELLRSFPPQLSMLAIANNSSITSISSQLGTQARSPAARTDSIFVPATVKNVSSAKLPLVSSGSQPSNPPSALTQQLQAQGLSGKAPQSTPSNLPPVTPQPVKTSPEAQLTESQLKETAQQITVRLATKLAKSGMKDETLAFRSGILIARHNSAYYVLTTANGADLQDQYEILVLGQDTYVATVIDKQPSLDLVVLEFTSKNDYKTAAISINSLSKVTDALYVGGWITLGQSTTFTLVEGEAVDAKALRLGENLIYTNRVANQMAGGAILNQYGQLIGIHKNVRKEGGLREGIPINTFLKVTSADIRKIFIGSPSGKTVSCDRAFLGSCTL